MLQMQEPYPPRKQRQLGCLILHLPLKQQTGLNTMQTSHMGYGHSRPFSDLFREIYCKNRMGIQKIRYQKYFVTLRRVSMNRINISCPISCGSRSRDSFNEITSPDLTTHHLLMFLFQFKIRMVPTYLGIAHQPIMLNRTAYARISQNYLVNCLTLNTLNHM